MNFLRNNKNNSNRLSSFFKNVKKGNIKLVNKYLLSGIKIDDKDNFNRTGLMYAIDKNKYNMINFLLSKNANLDIVDVNGWCALSLAVRSGNINIIKMLLINGANPDVEIPIINNVFSKYNCLMYSLLNTEIETIKLLLEYKANPNIICNNQLPIFFIIKNIEKFGIDIIKRLLSNNINLNVIDVHGYTPLMYLIDKINNNETLNILLLLLEHGANPNIKNKFGMTVLHLAIKNINDIKIKLDTVKYLLDFNCDVNIGASNTITPLMYSIMTVDNDLIKLLLDYGANPNVFNNKNYSSLTMAILLNEVHKSLEITKLLLENGADPNAKNSFGDTSFFSCMRVNNQYKSIEILKLLLKHHGNPHLKNNQLKTIFDIIHPSRVQIIENIIKKYTLNTNKTLYISSECPICYNEFTSENIRNFIVPCGHVCCSECINSITSCPICRKNINSYEKINLVGL